MYQYANELASLGHSVSVMHMRTPGASDNSRRVELSLMRIAYFFGRRVRPRWFKINRRVRVANYFRQHESYVDPTEKIIATALGTSSFVSDLALRRRIDGYYFLQHFEDYAAPREVVETSWRLPLRLIVVADWLGSIAAELGRDYVLVPNAVDSTAFQAGDPIEARSISVLAMLSGQQWKRTDLICEAMHEISDRLPGVSMAAFGTIARPDDLPSNVKYYRNPAQNRLPLLYQRSRLFICASDYEGFGLPVAEAMASSTAVVSTRNGGVESFAGEGVAYVDVGDLDEIVSKTLELLGDDSLCQQLASAGRDVISDYSLIDAGLRFEEAIS